MMTRRDSVKLALLACAAKKGLGQVTQTIPAAREYAPPVVGPDGGVAYRFRAFAGVVTIDLGEGEKLELACIPGGVGEVGSEDPYQPFPVAAPAKTPVRTVTVRPFCMGVFETTRGQWMRVSRMPQVQRQLRVSFAEPRSAEEARYPADEGISFEQAEEYCARLSRYTGLEIRIPSEVEWEYACRAGTRTRFHFGDVENRDFTVWSRFSPVGTHNEPNRYGLHDLHGGSDEWCADWGHADYRGAPNDQRPWTGSGDSSLRMVRGGIRHGSSNRYTFNYQGSYSTLGLRVAASIDHGIMDPVARAVANAASGETAASVAPGEIVSIYGDWLGPAAGVEGAVDTQTRRLRAELEGVEVWFDDTRAPLLYASRGQVNAIAPFGLEPGKTTRLVVRSGLQSAHPRELTVTPSEPGLFTLGASGAGPAAALNQDARLNSAGNPAAAGSIVTVYASGLGAFDRRLADGEIAAPGDLPGVSAQVRVEIGGLPAVVVYAGQAPGLVAGAVQINARLDSATPSGAQPIVVFAGERRSRGGVTVFVA